MTQIFTNDGWRDDQLDAREALGRNARHFEALHNHRAKTARFDTIATGFIAGLAAVGVIALGFAIWGAM